MAAAAIAISIERASEKLSSAFMLFFLARYSSTAIVRAAIAAVAIGTKSEREEFTSLAMYDPMNVTHIPMNIATIAQSAKLFPSFFTPVFDLQAPEYLLRKSTENSHPKHIPVVITMTMVISASILSESAFSSIPIACDAASAAIASYWRFPTTESLNQEIGTPREPDRAMTPRRI